MEKESLNRQLNIPLHFQLRVLLRKRITEGFYTLNSQIPNEMELCEEFQVSRPTVRRAIEDLVNEGLLVKIHPKGTFVRDCKSSEKTSTGTFPLQYQSSENLLFTLESPLIDMYLYQAVEAFNYNNNEKIIIQNAGSWLDGINNIVNTIITDQLPDIFLITNNCVQTYAQMGVIEPFDDYIDAGQLQLLRDRSSESYGRYFFDGKLYAYPFFADTRIMYYRKDIFDQQGLPYPGEGWTHGDFLEYCKRLTIPEKQQWAYAFPVAQDGDTLHVLMTWIMQRGGEVYQDIGDRLAVSTDQPGFAEGFKWVCDLLLKHGVCPPIGESGNYSKICSQFITGKIAMMMGQPSFSVFLDGHLPGKWNVAPLPMGGLHNRSYRGGMPLCISSRCRNKQLAYRFIRYITSREIMFPYFRRIRVFPPKELYDWKELSANVDPRLYPFLQAYPDSINWDRYPTPPTEGSKMEIWQMPVQRVLGSVLNGKMSYDTAISNITKSVKTILQK